MIEAVFKPGSPDGAPVFEIGSANGARFSGALAASAEWPPSAVRGADNRLVSPALSLSLAFGGDTACARASVATAMGDAGLGFCGSGAPAEKVALLFSDSRATPSGASTSRAIVIVAGDSGPFDSLTGCEPAYAPRREAASPTKLAAPREPPLPRRPQPRALARRDEPGAYAETVLQALRGRALLRAGAGSRPLRVERGRGRPRSPPAGPTQEKELAPPAERFAAASVGAANGPMAVAGVVVGPTGAAPDGTGVRSGAASALGGVPAEAVEPASVSRTATVGEVDSVSAPSRFAGPFGPPVGTGRQPALVQRIHRERVARGVGGIHLDSLHPIALKIVHVEARNRRRLRRCGRRLHDAADVQRWLCGALRARFVGRRRRTCGINRSFWSVVADCWAVRTRAGRGAITLRCRHGSRCPGKGRRFPDRKHRYALDRGRRDACRSRGLPSRELIGSLGRRRSRGFARRAGRRRRSSARRNASFAAASEPAPEAR